MGITLFKSGLNEAVMIHEMQVKSFMPLLSKYQDYDRSPANETVEQIIGRINQPFTDYYIINNSDISVGAIRIVKKENNTYRVSPLFILPEHQGQGIAQTVLLMIEDIYNDAKVWKLESILQEKGNCYLYEKLGYEKTGQLKEINERMTMVFYEKRIITL